MIHKLKIKSTQIFIHISANILVISAKTTTTCFKFFKIVFINSGQIRAEKDGRIYELIFKLVWK